MATRFPLKYMGGQQQRRAGFQDYHDDWLVLHCRNTFAERMGMPYDRIFRQSWVSHYEVR